MLTVIIVLALAVAGYFLYKKFFITKNSEEVLVKEVLKNIDSKPIVSEPIINSSKVTQPAVDETFDTQPVPTPEPTQIPKFNSDAIVQEITATEPAISAPSVEEPAPAELTVEVEETTELTEDEYKSEVAAGAVDLVTEESLDAKPVRKKKRRYYIKK
jgi:hypothetical protein